MSRRRGLIALAPAPPHAVSDGTSLPGSSSAVQLPPRRQSVVAACDACRNRKSKCSGERPLCDRCRHLKTPCHYDTLPSESRARALKRNYDKQLEQNSHRKELLGLLRSLPEEEAQNILVRLRSGASVKAILDHVHAADLLVQLSVTPETRLRYDFPYISQIPADLLSDNPYLASMIYESTLLYRDSQEQTRSQRAMSSGPEEMRHHNAHPYLKPIHASEVIEPQLSSVKPSQWTLVCDDDILMRRLLASLLRSEYTFQSPFQKDLFLEDMASGKHDFCSSLLVNSVFAYCCTCYSNLKDRSEYWNPNTLSYRFLAEAKRLWDLGAEDPRITTIQASIVLNLVHNFCGLDKIGRAYSIQGVTLARRIKLLETCAEVGDERQRHGRAFTAWMLYNFENLVAFHFMHPPLFAEAPCVDLPDPWGNAKWYGEVWVKYPLAQALSQTYFGPFFQAKCRLRVIVNQISWAYFADDAKATSEEAHRLHLRLEEWYQNLPKCLTERYIVHPGHFQLHIEYQNSVMTLYEPLLYEMNRQPSPQDIYAKASKLFQTLVRLYYLRHGFDTADVFFCQPLALMGFMCIRAISDQMTKDDLEATRSTLFLAAKGLLDQSRNYNLAGALFLVVRGQMRPEEASLMSAIAIMPQDEGLRRMTQIQGVHSQWPVSIVTKPDDLDAHRLAKLVDEFGSCNLSKEEVEGQEE